MDSLSTIRAALEHVPMQALRALQAAAQQTDAIAPGLFAWLEHATGWEIDRRRGSTYELREPHEAIDPIEAPQALLALAALLSAFRQSGSCAAVEQLLSASIIAIGPPRSQSH